MLRRHLFQVSTLSFIHLLLVPYIFMKSSVFPKMKEIIEVNLLLHSPQKKVGRQEFLLWLISNEPD